MTQEAGSAGSPHAAVLAQHHAANLQAIARLGLSDGWATPQERLRAIRFCAEYGVDYTRYARAPRPGFPSAVMAYVATDESDVVEPGEREVEVELVQGLLDDPQGVPVPRFELARWHVLLGVLHARCAQAIQSSNRRLRQ